ncbi:MAG TPA: DNA topoisomerase 3, partial [Candidatus Contendobacter sp.]|nr:DNA topoisomerase 3 [Candidatus Contendobacter sp.]
MSIAVVAEKPAVARDIARVLGARQRGEGYLHGNGYVVTWAIGHLTRLAEPHEINPDWKRWRRELLPMLPDRWPLIVSDQTREQFEAVRRILTDDAIERIICATDAGREGELIFRSLYEAAGCRKPFSRLWISSLTPDAIRQGFTQLRDGHEFDPLAAAAKGRSQADWLVGINLSRAYTLACGTPGDDALSVGRVQTPTLALVVERELAIRAFVPEDYQEVVAMFGTDEGKTTNARYQGVWFRGERPTDSRARRLPADGAEAARIIARARRGAAVIESRSAETRRAPPPLFYDLTELQRHANRLYGFSAQTTLDLAQALYEQHKLISYPRTDSRHLSASVAATLGAVVAAMQAPYADRLAPGTGQRPLSSRFVDDAKVSDHHAIIPTPTPARALASDEKKLYDLICRRLLMAWHDDHVWAVTTLITAITSLEPNGATVVDRYHSSGTAVEQVGWKILEVGADKPVDKAAGKRKAKAAAESAVEDEAEQSLPPGLTVGQPQQVLDARAVAKQTRPPPRLTEAALLTAMETAGRHLEDKELSAAMKERGLGTPATRAEIIETLLKRQYLTRDGKSLIPTERGLR